MEYLEALQVFEQMNILVQAPLIIEQTANTTELLQMFKVMIILFKALLIMKTDGISNFTNCFNWYLGAFYFNCSSQLIYICRFWAIKLNGSIKCCNCNYYKPQNLHVMVEFTRGYCIVWIINIGYNWTIHWLKHVYIFPRHQIYTYTHTLRWPNILSGKCSKINSYCFGTNVHVRSQSI